MIRLQASSKLLSIGVVTRRVWAEAAAWKSLRSALAVWGVSWQRGTPGGLRVTTPWFGVAVGLWLGRQ